MAKGTKKGIVYIVQNPAFSHLFKIGYTEKNTVEDRGLNASNVPEDFEVLFGYECDNPKEIEEHLHDTFNSFRHYTRKGRKTEFFYIGCLLKAKKTLELLNGAREVSSDNIVLEKDNKNEYDDTRNIEEITTKIKKPFAFNMVDIKPGTVLVFTRNKKEECIVKDNKMVLYKGEEYFLSSLARKLMEKLGYANNSGAYQGPAYFKVKGEEETLSEKREKLES